MKTAKLLEETFEAEMMPQLGFDWGWRGPAWIAMLASRLKSWSSRLNELGGVSFRPIEQVGFFR